MRLSLPGLLAVLVPALGGPAMAGTTLPSLSASDILQQFNAVVSGNFTSNSDVEGRLAVGGNMNGGTTFYLNPETTSSAYGAVNVYGNVAQDNYYNINNGGNVNVAGTNNGKFNMNGGGTISSTALNGTSFSSNFASPMSGLVSQLSGLTANNTLAPVTQNNMNNYAITGTNANANGIAVFDVTAAQLEQMASFSVNLGNASTVVIDVTGNYTQNANNLTAASADAHVVWNFEDASTVNLQGFGGTVLAQNATVTNTSALNGDLYAANFNGQGEIHTSNGGYSTAFVDPLTASPAPMRPLGGSLAGLLAITAFGTVRVARKRAAVT